MVWNGTAVDTGIHMYQGRYETSKSCSEKGDTFTNTSKEGQEAVSKNVLIAVPWKKILNGAIGSPYVVLEEIRICQGTDHI